MHPRLWRGPGPGPRCRLRSGLCAGVLAHFHCPTSGACAPVLLLNEAAVSSAYPLDARGVPEHENGTADVHVAVVWELAVAGHLATGHDGAERLGVGLAVAGRTAAPVELGVVDGLVTGVPDKSADLKGAIKRFLRCVLLPCEHH